MERTENQLLHRKAEHRSWQQDLKPRERLLYHTLDYALP